MLVWGLVVVVVVVVVVALAVRGIVALFGTCPARACRALGPGGSPRRRPSRDHPAAHRWSRRTRLQGGDRPCRLTGREHGDAVDPGGSRAHVLGPAMGG